MIEPGLSLGFKQYPRVWHGLKPPSAPQISWAQNTLLFPLSPPGTFTLCGYFTEGGAGRREPETRGWGPRSLDKLAKPLRWFQLKLAVLPVGSINSELAQTLTSMGELFPLALYLGAPSVWLSLSLSSFHPILSFLATFLQHIAPIKALILFLQFLPHSYHRHRCCFNFGKYSRAIKTPKT